MRPILLIGYLLGIVMLALGVMVLAGALDFRWGQGDTTLRTVFGVVLALYGVYRLVVTDTQRRKEGRAS